MTDLAQKISNRAEDQSTAAGVNDVSEWFTPWRFAAILLTLIVTCFPEVVAGLRTFFFRDFGMFAYPLAYYHRESFWRGEMPLWNPLNYCGVPFLAQWNTMTLYPPSLFYLIFPLSWSLGIFNLAHLFFAGMGMYFLAHRWTGNRFAASVAGIVFAFNGLTWNSLMWPNNIAALGWMPWVVLTVERAWREGGARRLIVAALAGAMQMLAGAPEVIILTWFFLGTLWLVEFVRGEVPRAWILWRFCFVGCVVAILAAAQLLPFLELLANSQRDTGFGDSQWSMARGGWANYLVPLFHCLGASQGVYLQNTQFWTASYYLGVGTVALALLALWKARDWRSWVLIGLAAFSLTMALGDNGKVYTVVKKVAPMIGFMRFPIKFVVLATFVVPLLAAMSLSRLVTLPEKQWLAERKGIVWLGLAMVGAIAFIVWWEWKHPLSEEYPLVTLKNALGRAGFLALILACLVTLRQVKQARLRHLLGVCFLLLFWFDVFTHAPNLSPTVEREAYEPNLIRNYLKLETQLKPGEARAMESRAALNTMTFGAVNTPRNDVIGRRLSLLSNCNLLDDVAKFDGFFSLNVRETSQLITGVYMATNQEATGLKDFLGISHINHPTNAFDWIPRTTFLPMITVGQAPVFVADKGAFQIMTGATFDPRQVVCLPPEAQSSVIVSNRTEAKLISTQFEAQKVGAEIEASSPSMMVVAQSFYRPWHAYVDGKATRLWRANYAFQALEVPAGRHAVSLVYEDKLFIVGVAISLSTLMICLVVWIGTLWKKATNGQQYLP